MHTYLMIGHGEKALKASVKKSMTLIMKHFFKPKSNCGL